MFKTGRYEIAGEIGRGSMGVVYEGFDPLINRRVAIKTMRTEGLSDREYQDYKARFQSEAQSAGALAHPNIVTIHDFGEDHGVLYLAMEFLDGISLRQLLDEKGTLPIQSIIPIFQQASSALDYAHSHQIVHRDIKPANIMILESGLVKVTDFGIAKVLSNEAGMTLSGQILGTPTYMSPEQVKGQPVDGRSDIFAVGVDLHGVHDFTTPESGAGRGFAAAGGGAHFNQPPDLDRAREVAWQSSPVSSVKTWKSPVLLIQGDDDRNVRFHQTVDLARRLAAQGVPFEELVLPDEIHGFLRHASWMTADSATARFFDRVFRGVKSTTASR